MKTCNSIFSLAVGLILAACATKTSNDGEKPPVHASRVQILTYDSTPRSKSARIDVYDETLPAKPYKVIAVLTCEGAAHEEVPMMEAIFYRSRQIGADAVIRQPPDMTWAQFGTIGGSRRVFRAKAVVYESK